MRTVISYLILLAVFTLSTTSADAQRRGKVDRALQAYEAGEYYEAIDLLKEAYDMVSDREEKSEIIFKIAESYRRTNNPKSAEMNYKKAILRDYQNPVAILYYADMMKMNEKYEEAIEQYRRYAELVPEDPRGNDGILSSELALQWMENPNGYEVEEMKFINTRESDYSPAFAREDYMELYFTTSREGSNGTEIHGATGENFTDIFVTKQDRKGKWSEPVPIDGEVSSEYEDGTPSFSSDFRTMYFTRCFISEKEASGCQVMYARKSGDTWGKPDALPLIGDSLVAAHPAIAPDELTLYFVTDVPGGIGGKDIYKVERESKDGDWGEPENMGEQINTVGDELFPYVHPDGTLYFSSTGHVGMGGLDIFKATLDENDNWKVENMRYPINSHADDFGITFKSDVEAGFFTSSRGGRSNDDIYSFLLPPLKFNITGEVRDEETNEIIPDATVKSISSDGVTLETTTQDDGSFKFMLKPATDYVFIASAENYLNGKERETTKGLDKSRDFTTTIYLASIEKPIELPNIFYDFAKWDLRPESMVSLDKLVETLNDNPNITIELMSHTDSRGSAQANIELSQKRAQSVVDYLIEKGIKADRLTAKGYGESQPKEIDASIVEQYPTLEEGVVLTEEYIQQLPDEELQEIAHQINRRTEFRVLTTDYNQ